MTKPDYRVFFGDEEEDPIAKAAEKVLNVPKDPKAASGTEEAKKLDEEEDTEEKSLARGNPPGWSKKTKEEKQKIIKSMKKRHGAKIG